jgi:phage N-6-adenine-methyltransferase
MDAALFSSARTGVKEQDNWQTPAEVLDLVRSFLKTIDLDPCTSPDNPTGAAHYLTEFENGLAPGAWPGFGPVFINPPYSDMPQWAVKIADEVARTGLKREYIVLVPARTDTRWWHTLMAARPARVLFWKGRIKFNRPDGTPGMSAPFPSALLYFGADDLTFTRTFCDLGWIARS